MPTGRNGKMKFALINPEKRTNEVIEAKDVKAALKHAGLEPGQVDHGSITRYIHFVCYEFCLFVPLAEQFYFTRNHKLFAGNVVFYMVNDLGETVDFDTDPSVYFLGNGYGAEQAVRSGRVDRPMVTLNGEIMWMWPDPPPADLAAEMGFKMGFKGHVT
jgi:hypothetical protein